MIDQSKIEILTSFLSNYIIVGEKEKEFLQNIVKFKIFKKKEIIHQQGQLQKNIGLIIKGAVRIFCIDKDGNEDTLEFAFENDPIGEYNNLITQETSPASAQAIEETELIYISKEDFSEFMRIFPQYYIVITQIMGDALSTGINRNKLSRITSSRERYDEFCKTFEAYSQRIPLTYIASYLNMTLATLSRVRAGKL